MVGYGPNKGLVPKLCERLFQAIRENQETRQCQVKKMCLCVAAHDHVSVSYMAGKTQNVFVLYAHAGLFQYVGNL